MKEHEEEGEKQEEEKDIVDFLLEVYQHEVCQNPYQGFLAGKCWNYGSLTIEMVAEIMAHSLLKW